MKNGHDLVIFENGEVSVQNSALGETMHSKIGPWKEAHSIYIEQSGLSSRLAVHKERSSPLVIFDVGLGLAANSIAALECRRRLMDTGKKLRPLQTISFENDPSGLELALRNPEKFPFLSGYQEILEKLLHEGKWHSPDGELCWELRLGDFSQWVQTGFADQPRPELIFYDFYSPKSQPELWRVENFVALRRVATADALLLTYSVATAIRVAMVLGGFIVGRGIRTGAKLETTIAACRPELLAQPLGLEWIEKLRRSTKILPYGFEEADREKLLGLVAQALGVSSQEAPQ